ncbi:hypothetical protein F4809DRAFT_605835 [Biscogniauxia mediterranea]|nr:hypothetical protein F4809DRAFT_605835 [Biscogniauxia mediterranea]
MSLSKQQISSPLEAGRSLLDTHSLPSHLTGTLEYMSKRLARKALHITLVVVRNEYQLPSSIPPCATPTSPPITPESRAGFASPRFASPMTGLRQLVRRGTNSSISSSSTSETSTSISALSSPTFSPAPTESLASPRRWIVPPTPGTPYTPMTPHTPYSVATAVTSTSATSTVSSSSSTTSQSQGNGFGIRLLYTSPLSLKAERALRATMIKAERKFRPGVTGWLFPPVMTAAACGLNQDLVRRSILQNEVLFSSEGLTLLGLDRLYTFKAALAAYARSIPCPPVPSPSAPLHAPLSSHPVLFINRDGGGDGSNRSSNSGMTTRLEEAVDSLRRLILLANSGRPVPKADLYRSYDWLGVNPRALSEVERMYRRAYGGPERKGPFEAPTEVAVMEESFPKREGQVEHEEAHKEKKVVDEKELSLVPETPVFKIGAPPPPKSPPRAQTTPVLKLNTNVPTVVTAKKPDMRLARTRVKPVVGLKAQPWEAPWEVGKNTGAMLDVDRDSRPLHRRHQQGNRRDKSPHPGEEVDIGDLGLDLELELEIRIDHEDDHHHHDYSNNSNNKNNYGYDRVNNNDYHRHPRLLPGHTSSISEVMLSPCENPNEDEEDGGSSRQHRLGPTTPNGYDDISPVTRGEWGFLFQGLGTGRTVAVERC